MIPSAIPWYKSAVFQGICVSAFVQLLRAFNLDKFIPAAQAPDIVNGIIDLVSGAALAWAAHGRTVKPLPQVTLTQSDAEVINKQVQDNAKTTVPIPPPPGA